MSDIPYELSCYIGEKQRRAGDANACDHKPTYQAEFDSIRAKALLEYEKGNELLESISKGDKARCRRLYAHRGGYSPDELAQFYIGRKFVVVPRYIGLIEEVRTLSKVLE